MNTNSPHWITSHLHKKLQRIIKMCFLISKKIYEVTTGKLYQQKRVYPFLTKAIVSFRRIRLPEKEIGT